jgi:hypothetical protein
LPKKDKKEEVMDTHTLAVQGMASLHRMMLPPDVPTAVASTTFSIPPASRQPTSSLPPPTTMAVPLVSATEPVLPMVVPSIPAPLTPAALPAPAHRKRARSTSTATRKYLAVTDTDVLLGRGGRTNNHAGNKDYLLEKERIQERYLKASKQTKTGIAQELVDYVHARGGRFLKLDEATDQWYEVSNIVARKKCSQSLREINTPEERASKRARYGK